MSISAPSFLRSRATPISSKPAITPSKAAPVKEEPRDRSFVKKALIFEMRGPVSPHDDRFYEDTINFVLSQHPNATGEMLEIVLMSRDKNDVGWPCDIFVPNDSDLILELFRQLRLDSANNDNPAAWKIKYDFNLFDEYKKRQKKPVIKSRVQPATPDKPFIVDPATVPEHLRG